jgi:hypothetical protein
MKHHQHKNVKLFGNGQKQKPLPRRERRMGIGEAIVDVALLGAAVGIIKGAYK